MIYRDGFAVDKNMRFIKCPKCGNEEYSDEAVFCKICGLPVYNVCDGSAVYDDCGNEVDFKKHKNAGNARYCEHCGEKTMLLKTKLLCPYTEYNVRFKLDIEEEMPF